MTFKNTQRIPADMFLGPSSVAVKLTGPLALNNKHNFAYSHPVVVPLAAHVQVNSERHDHIEAQRHD